MKLINAIGTTDKKCKTLHIDVHDSTSGMNGFLWHNLLCRIVSVIIMTLNEETIFSLENQSH